MKLTVDGTIVAGWYQSETNPGHLQWWDGQAWTAHLVRDFSHVQPGKMRRKAARETVTEMMSTIRALEEMINTHGIRTAADNVAWRDEEVAKLARRELSVQDIETRAGSVAAEAERRAGGLVAEAERQAGSILSAAEHRAGDLVALAESNAQARRNLSVKQLEEELRELNDELARLRAEVIPMRDVAPLQEVGYFDYEHPAELSTSIGTELESVREQIKAMIRENKAATATTSLTFEGSAAKGKRLIENLKKVLLRAYNAEAENAVKATRAGNADTAQARLSRAADQIAKNGEMISMRITSEFHRLRLKEIELANRHLKALQREKELERERREELREQRKVEMELKKEQERLEKERGHYLSTIAVLESKGDDEGAQRIREKLADVDRAIEDVDYRTANIRAGYVYVISNVGSFGHNVVKIGMTRRLEPMDRVRELGDASVPFRFDVHALFFADDAVSVENMLHKEFAGERINQVNLRREYFRVTPQEVLDKLQKHDVEVLEFTLEPEALEHRESLAMLAQSAQPQV